MTITKHNYEEFFLLYVDNELNASEKKAVEDFVKEYPEYREELDALLQTQLQAPAMGFDKSFLYKSEIFDDGLLVQYIDNELAETERNIVEETVQRNEVVAKELALLQRTKLTAEVIPFKNKEVLYRKEGRVVQVITWRHWVAAASVLLMGGLFWLNMNNPSTVTQTNPVISKNAENNNTSPLVAELPTNQIPEISKKESLSKNESPEKQSNIKAATGKDQQVGSTKQVGNTQQIILENIAATTKPKIETVTDNKPLTNEIAKIEVPIPETTISPVKPVILSEDDFIGEEKDVIAAVEPGILTGDEINEKESKLNGNIRGFLRKTSRIINRSKVTEPDAEEEASKSVVRIASFAIAKK